MWGEEGEESRWGGGGEGGGERGRKGEGGGGRGRKGEGRGGREGEASPIQSVFIVIKRTFWKVGCIAPA